MKGKSTKSIIPIYTIKAYKGSSGVAPLILKFDAIWR